jgi:L-asparaginase
VPSSGDQTLPYLRLFTTGGTIASRRDPATGAVRAVAGGDELLALVPELGRVAHIVVEPFAAVNGWNVTPPMMFDLARRIEAALAEPAVTGAIVTHGTDTVEETAYLVDLVLRSDKPVVFAVAMRNLSELGTDGPRNLLDAARVAVSPTSRGRGALLVLNETVHAARYVTKTHTVNPAAFDSPNHGPAAVMNGADVRYLHQAPARRPIATDRIEPEVFLLKMAAGTDDRALRWALEAGFRGLVVEGTGSGNVPAAVVPGIAAAVAAGMPVILTSRVVRGFLAPVYGSGGAAGGGFDLAQLGVIPADGLPGQKARIKLMVALGTTSDPAEIRRLFEET